MDRVIEIKKPVITFFGRNRRDFCTQSVLAQFINRF